MSHRASPAAAAALQHVDLAVDSSNGVLAVDVGNGLFETVVLTSSGGHVGRRRPIVAAGIAVDSLALVAAMVDAFPAPTRAEHLVRQFGPSLACTLYPLLSVKRSALRRAAPIRDGRNSPVETTERGPARCHRSGVIVAHMLTEATVDNATTGIGLVEALDADIARVTADAAYDTIAFYDTATARGATVVVPPNKTARVSRRRPRSSARDRTINKMEKIGRRRWKKEAGYHR
jgi:hypothetical protein